MISSVMAPKAKVAEGPRCSRGKTSRGSSSSFSAAADLVVKTSTPPKKISGGVGNAIVTVSPFSQRFANMRSDTDVTATKLVSHLEPHSKKGHPEQTNQEAETPEHVADENLGSQALVEVRSMSGNSIFKADFQLSERVSSIKDRILKIQSIPIWQQKLIFKGVILDDQSTLSELDLLQGAVFELVLMSGPSPEDMEALADVAREIFAHIIKGIDTLTTGHIMELKLFGKPPVACEQVCLAALHMLAGLAPQIPIKRNGRPKDADWSGCKHMMMTDPKGFRLQVLELPSCIDQGRVLEDNVVICRQLINAIEGNSDSEKIQYMARCSLMCQQLLRFLIGVVKYYDCVTEFRKRFGGATITELKSHQ